MGATMITIQQITKKYGNFYALKSISFEIPENTVLGLLGQNGAGKTTLMDILCACSHASSGNILIDEISLQTNPDAYKRKIGYMPEVPPVYGEMTVNEYLNFVAEIKQVVKQDKIAHVNETIALCALQNVKHRLIGNLSKGYKQRVSLAQALIGNAELLVLDEPSVGLDPKQTAEMIALIKKLSKDHTIIISSHRLYEIEQLCTQYVILHKGEIKHIGNVSAQTNDYILCLSIESKHIDSLKKLLEKEKNTFQLQEITSFSKYGYKLCQLRILCKTDYAELKINALLQNTGIAVIECSRTQKNLENIFLELTKE